MARYRLPTLLMVLGTIALYGWGFLSIFILLAAITLASTGPNPVPWGWIFAFIGATGLVPLGLFAAAFWLRKRR